MRKRVIYVLILSLITGCVSGVNLVMRVKPDYSTVPETELRQLAGEIELAVKNGDRDAEFTDRAGLVLSTPEIQQALRTRVIRAELVNDFLETGHVCERQSGLLDILRTKAYKQSGSSRERDRNALVVMSENRDRWTLYEDIVEASNLSPKALSAVRAIFFEARLALLEPGQKYEDEDGSIVVKAR